MALNVSTITPASLKAKEIATEEYVDTAVSNFPATDAEWQVRVQSALDADATIINGSKITTGSIDASLINTGILNSNLINGQTITGAKIYGAYIEGAVIRSSWIDDSMSGYLTYWAEFTPAQVMSDYSEYVNNFAKENGVLFTDPEGKARLQGFPIAYSKQSQVSGRAVLGDTVMLNIGDNIMAYDSYQSNSINRVRSAAPKLGATEHTLFRVVVGA